MRAPILLRPRRDHRRLGRRASLVLLADVSLTVLLASLLGYPARADDRDASFRMVVHPDNPATSIGRDLLSDMFLKTISRWEDGEVVRAVDQRPDSYVRQAFSQSVLKRSVVAVRSYWQQRIFSGRDVPPPELDSDDAVVDYVLGHRGGIGYVSATAKVREAKVLVIR